MKHLESLLGVQLVPADVGAASLSLSFSFPLETIVEGGRYREAAKRATDREGTARRVDGKRNADEENCRRRERERERKRDTRKASNEAQAPLERERTDTGAEPVCASASESD